MVMKYRSTIAILSLLLLTSFSVFEAKAQRDTLLRQEVEVIKSFSPASMDAEKINEIPAIREEQHQKPTFNYSIFSQPVVSSFSVQTLQAATIVGKPPTDSFLGLLQLGAGNYNTPYGEFLFNNKNAKNSILGIHLKHLSSHSQVKLDNGDKAEAPWSDNHAELYLQQMVKRSALTLSADFGHKGFNYYGYPGTDPLPDSIGNYATLLGNRQTFTRGGVNLSMKSFRSFREDPVTGFDAGYQYFQARTGQQEHFARLLASYKKPWRKVSLMVEGSGQHARINNVMPDSLGALQIQNQTLAMLRPMVYFGNETINLTAGSTVWLGLSGDNKTTFRYAPKLHVNIAPLKNILSIFAGVDGAAHFNHYSAVAAQNPYINPEMVVDNHFEKYNIYGGIKTRTSGKTSATLKANYTIFENHPLFYLPLQHRPVGLISVREVNNLFAVAYDDMERLTLGGEINFILPSRVKLLLSGNYHVYTMDKETTPWNLPNFEGLASISYHIGERLLISSDIFVRGNREALLRSPLVGAAVADETYSLPWIADVNAGVQYTLTRNLSAFAQMNNAAFQQMQQWYGYNLQSFNFITGLSLRF